MPRTTPADPNPPRDCHRCQAPLGVSDLRCPFCGAEQGMHAPSSVNPPPFEAAKLGLTDHVKHRTVKPIALPARPESPAPRIAVGVVVASLMIGGSWYLYQKMYPPPAPPAPAKLPPLTPVVSSVGGLAVPDADRLDPTDLIPLMRRTLAPRDPDAKLLGIQVKGSRNGVVDLTKPENSVVYTFALMGEPEPHKPKVPQSAKSYTLKLGGGGAQDVALSKEDQTLPEPNCVWSAAYRAALRSGVPADVNVDGVYGRFGGEPRWRVSVEGKPEHARDIDGMSCVIKVR